MDLITVFDNKENVDYNKTKLKNNINNTISNTKYVDFCLIQIKSIDDISFHSNYVSNFLEKSDYYKIWLWSKDDPLYYEDYYRIDFNNYIFLFQYLEESDGILMYGNLLQRDFETRIDLAQLKQKYLIGLVTNEQ